MKNNFDQHADDQAFDKAMRDAFEGFEMPAADKGAWADFERLQKSEQIQNDAQFDAHLSEVFQHFELPATPNDWKRLEADLDKRRHRPLAVWFYKGLEIALMTGVFALLFQWAGSGSYSSSDSSNNNSSSQQQKALKNAAAKGSSNGNSSNLAANNNAAPNNNSSSNNNSAAALNAASTTNSSAKTTRSKSNNFDAKSSRKTTNSTKNSVNGNANNSGNINASTPTLANTQQPNNTLANATDGNQKANDNAANANITSTVDLLALQAIDAQQAKITTEPSTDPADFSLRKVKIQQPYVRVRKFGVIAGAEAHSRTEYGRAGSGFAVGVFGEGDFSRQFALQMGVTLSLRSYEQERAYTLDNTQLVEGEEGLTHQVSEQRRTHSLLLQIPVSLQFSVFRNAKWRIYAQLGASAHLNLSQIYGGSRQTTLQQTDGALRYSSPIGKNDYEGGLLQGHSLADNSYLSCQFGLGIDRQLTERLSLSIQPSFQQSLTRINRYGDKTQVISLQVGLKSNF